MDDYRDMDDMFLAILRNRLTELEDAILDFVKVATPSNDSIMRLSLEIREKRESRNPEWYEWDKVTRPTKPPKESS